MALAMPTAQRPARSNQIDPARRWLGLTLLAVGASSWVIWIVWRLGTTPLDPISIMLLLTEVIGVVCGAAVGLGLASANDPRAVFVEAPSSHRFAFAVADIVRRTRADDLRRSVRLAARAARAPRARTAADAAIAGVLFDGPRRMAMIVLVVGALLVGVSPMQVPPVSLLIVVAVAMASTSLAHICLGRGRIRCGDRVRWTYSSVGDFLVGDDLDGVAPRRWVGLMATAVIVDLAIALRGMSDRWTHGLPAMGHHDRVAVMVLALMLEAGALFALATTSTPQLPNAHLVARRIEERTARQSALGAAVAVGVIGLIAGILPGGVDAADRDPGRVEHVSQLEGGDAGG
jgi:hypothetical protein